MLTVGGVERFLTMAVKFRGRWWLIEILIGLTFLLGVVTKG